jgi:hypothetical protein
MRSMTSARQKAQHAPRRQQRSDRRISDLRRCSRGTRPAASSASWIADRHHPVFQIWTGGTTLSSQNLINVVSQQSYILILAIGMVMVIIMGHIDLSVGSVAAFVGIIVAQSMSEWNMPWPVAISWARRRRARGAWQGSGSRTSECRRSS